MRITRETLINVAKETVQKRVLSEPGLIAAYLTGSVLDENPFIGNATDIDLVFVHTREPKMQREIVPLTPEIHLDIRHNTRVEYDKPKELRVHPWMGPELYDPMPLHVTRHFFEFVQAGVRDKYHDPDSVLTRSRRLSVAARQVWNQLQLSRPSGPELLIPYLSALHLAANAVALLERGPLAERRLLLQFPEAAEAVGHPGLSAGLLGLLGANRLDKGGLQGFLPAWEADFLEAAGRPRVEARIAKARLGYYRMAFDAMLESETPQAVVWPLINTWTLAAAILPPAGRQPWQAACERLGLDDASLTERLEGLDRFLDSIDELLEKQASGQGS
jgi:hypothetical protein